MACGQLRRGEVFGRAMACAVVGVGLMWSAGSAFAQETGNRPSRNAPPPGLAAPEAVDLSEAARNWEAIDHTDKLGTVRKHGTGDRPMVLIPATGYSGAVFYPTFQDYADAATMYAVTLRGTGGTAPLPGDATEWADGAWTNTSAQGIAELLIAEDLSGVVLVAHGNGAQMAWLAAAAQPERVAGIVVLDGYAVHPVPAMAETGRRGMVEALEQRMARGSDENNERIRRAMIGAMVQSVDDSRLLTADHMTTPRPVYRRYQLEAQNNDITAVMNALAKPALVIASLPDNARGVRIDVIRERFETVYANVPNAFIEYFDQTRHFVMFDNPDLLQTAIMEFVKALPPVEPADAEDEADSGSEDSMP